MTNTNLIHRATAFRRAATAACLGALIAAGGCGDALEVETPDILPPEDLEGAASIPTVFAGLVGDFSFAVVGDQGGSEGLISVTGSISDELGNSETFPTRKEYDIREMLDANGTLTGLFRRLHRARRAAEKGAEAIKNAAPNPAAESRIAESYNLAGVVYTLMAEAYCSGVPISDADPISGELIFGPSLTSEEMYERAIELHDSAAKYAINAAQASFARVGTARALMNLGRYDEARDTVATVLTTFRYVTTHTNLQPRQWNGVNAFINQFERFTLVNGRDGTNGIDFTTVQDPRVPWIRTPATDFGFDGSTPQYDQGVYPSETASLPIATGVEARLIEAEVMLSEDDAGWLTTLNTLRATTALYPPVGGTIYPQFPALGALGDPGTDDARLDLVFQERAFWLFLTGHRMGDLRRLQRQYGRTDAIWPGAGGQPYIINTNNKGGNFGNDVAIPIPLEETNNPNYTPNYPACKTVP